MNALIHAALSNAVLVCVAALVAALLSLAWRNPAWRHSLWLLVLLKLVMPPLVDLPLGWPRAVSGGSDRARSDEPAIAGAVPSSAAAAPSVSASAGADPSNGLLPGARAPTRAGATPGFAARVRAAGIAWWPGLRWIAATCWLAGSAVWFTAAACAVARFRRRLRGASPAPAELQRLAADLAGRLGLRRVPTVVVLSGRFSPLLWAVGRRQHIVLPQELLPRLSRDEVGTLLLHELAHLRRKDHLVRWVEFAACGVFWWHPVLWWTRRELHRAEEQCCDAWVAWSSPVAHEAYATALLRTLQYLCESRARLVPLANGIGQVEQLKKRLRLIVGGNVTRRLGGWGTPAIAFLALGGLPWCLTRDGSAAGNSAAAHVAVVVSEPPPAIEVSPASPPAVSLEELCRKASAGEKYTMLLAQIAAPSAAAQFGAFTDLGYRDAGWHGGSADLPGGYWVYAEPYWYLWGSASEYRREPRPWSPEQATGAPNTARSGDLSTAWASLCEDEQDEWLMLEYAEAVVPSSVRVYETYRPGALVKVTAFRLDGEEVVVWEGRDPTPPSLEWGVSEIPCGADFPTRRIKLHLRSTTVNGWNEIDAVELVDAAGRGQWATAARASSSYGDLRQVVVRSADPALARAAETTWIVISPEALARAEQRLTLLEEELRRLKQECRDLARLRSTADEISRMLRNEDSEP